MNPRILFEKLTSTFFGRRFLTGMSTITTSATAAAAGTHPREASVRKSSTGRGIRRLALTLAAVMMLTLVGCGACDVPKPALWLRNSTKTQQSGYCKCVQWDGAHNITQKRMLCKASFFV